MYHLRKHYNILLKAETIKKSENLSVFNISNLNTLFVDEPSSKSLSNHSRSMGSELRHNNFTHNTYILEQFDSFQDEHTRAWLSYIAGSEWLGVRAELLTATFLAAASVAAVTTSADAGFTGLALYSAVSLTQIIYLAVHNSVQFEGLMTSVERVLEYGQLASEPGYQVEAESPTHDQWPQEGAISCEDLSLVYYEGGPKTLKDVTFTVKSKEKVSFFIVMFASVYTQGKTQPRHSVLNEYNQKQA